MGAGGVAASFPWALWCPLVSGWPRMAPAGQREGVDGEKGREVEAWEMGGGFSGWIYSCSGPPLALCAPWQGGPGGRHPVLEEEEAGFGTGHSMP